MSRERTSPQYESFHELYKNYTTKALTEKAKSLKLVNYSKLNKKRTRTCNHGSANGTRWKLLYGRHPR